MQPAAAASIKVLLSEQYLSGAPKWPGVLLRPTSHGGRRCVTDMGGRNATVDFARVVRQRVTRLPANRPSRTRVDGPAVRPRDHVDSVPTGGQRRWCRPAVDGNAGASLHAPATVSGSHGGEGRPGRVHNRGQHICGLVVRVLDKCVSGCDRFVESIARPQFRDRPGIQLGSHAAGQDVGSQGTAMDVPRREGVRRKVH